MSDTITPEHQALLDQLGIGPNSRAAARPLPRFQADLAPTGSLFAPPPLPTIEELNLTPLYEYQQTALDRVWEAIEAGETRIMLMLPTGGGKTVLGAHIVAHKSQKGKVSAFPVPLLSLILQTFERFKQYGLRNIGVIQGRNKWTDPNATLQICSIQTLAARRKNGKRELDNLGLVIVDEAHLKHGEIYRLMEEWPDVVFVGLSATPWAKGLGLHWKKLIICETIAGLIEWGKTHPKEGLVPFVTYAPGIVPDLRKVKDNIEGNDYDVGALAKVMDNTDLIGDVVKTWKEKGEDRPTFCFCVNRAHGKHVNACFVEAGVASEYMDANTPMFEREEIFKRYRAGVTRVICSIGVLTAGVDEDVRCIIIARPTKSPILWVQIIGRGLRRAEGKDHLLILDHSGNSLRLGTVDQIFFDTLHDGQGGPDLWSDEEREAAALAKQSLPKLCPECAAVIARHELKCSQCGHEFKPVSNVKVIEGDLVKLGSGAQARIGATVQERMTFYRECLGYAKIKGIKPGVAYYAHLERYNFKSPWEWNKLEPLPPSQETQMEIRRQYKQRKAIEASMQARASGARA
jgi:superfamily II DNA or RNA helicase